MCLSLATLTRSALNNLLSLTRALFIVINFLFVNVGSHSDVKNIERAIQCTKVRGSVFLLPCTRLGFAHWVPASSTIFLSLH